MPIQTKPGSLPPTIQIAGSSGGKGGVKVNVTSRPRKHAKPSKDFMKK